MNTWLIIHTPAGAVHAWEVWAEDEPPDNAIIDAARVSTGFPANDEWAHDEYGWDIQLTLGRPHDKLMKRATVGTVEELRKVDAAAVQAHTAGRLEATQRAHVDELRARLAELDDETLAAVLGGPDAVTSLRAAHASDRRGG